MSVAEPALLLLAVVAAGAVWWLGSRSGWARPPRGLAAAAAGLFALVPAGIETPAPGGPTRIVVVDRSGSVGKTADAPLQAWLAALGGNGARVGVVSFGESAAIERLPAPGSLADVPPAPVGGEGSDLAAGLVRARELLPPEGGEVILLSDGRATRGDGLSASRAIRAGGGRITVVPVGRPGEPDAAAVSLEVPAGAPPGATVEIRGVVRLDSAGHAAIAFGPDPGPRSEEIQGDPGELRTLVRQERIPGGSAPGAAVRFALAADGKAPTKVGFPGQTDAVPENSHLQASTLTSGPRAVLILSRTGQASFAPALQETGDLLVLQESLSERRGELAGYACVVIEGPNPEGSGTGLLETLARYVQSGGGLLLAGGPESFGLGGWAGTPLERVSPVWMDPRKDRALALALAVDCSGSMAELVPGGGGETKMDAAREAVRGLVAALRPGDTLLLVPFRSEAEAPREVPGGDPGSPAASTALAALAAGGSTRIRPGIEVAIAWLQERPEPARHLVVLSDGRDEALAPSGKDREPVATSLAAAATREIGLTALEAGESSVLQELFRAAGGRGLPLASFRDLSDALRRELFLARGDLEWRGPARPGEAKAAAEVLGEPARGALANPPLVERALRTAPKEGAQVLLGFREADGSMVPLMVLRRAGLGSCAAFTSSPAEGWAPEWGRTSEGATLLRRLLEAVMSSGAGELVDARVRESDEGVVLSARWKGPDPADGRRLSVRDGDAAPVRMRPVDTGRYEATLPRSREARVAAVVEGDGPEARAIARVPLPGGYSPEWRRLGVDRDALRALAEAGGGDIADEPALWRPWDRAGRGRRSLDGALLLAGMALAFAAFVSRRRAASRAA